MSTSKVRIRSVRDQKTGDWTLQAGPVAIQLPKAEAEAIARAILRWAVDPASPAAAAQAVERAYRG